MQELWRRHLDWDDPLPSDLQPVWQRWLDELGKVNPLEIPRHVFLGNVVQQVDMHVFCDASDVGFGAVLYFRWKDRLWCCFVLPVER